MLTAIIYIAIIRSHWELLTSFLSSPSKKWAGPVSQMCLLRTGLHAQTSPILALWLCSYHLESRNHCQTRSPVFSFALGPANNVAVQGADVCKQSILLSVEKEHSNVSGKDQTTPEGHGLQGRVGTLWGLGKTIHGSAGGKYWNFCLWTLSLIVYLCFWMLPPAMLSSFHFMVMPISQNCQFSAGHRATKIPKLPFPASIAAWCLIADVAMWSFLVVGRWSIWCCNFQLCPERQVSCCILPKFSSILLLGMWIIQQTILGLTDEWNTVRISELQQDRGWVPGFPHGGELPLWP